MTPEQKKALQTIQDTDFGFGDNAPEQVDLQELQELAGESAVTGELGSDITELAEKVKESLNDLEQSISVYIEEYVLELDPIAKKAARVAELIAPGAEGNPQNEEWRDEEVASTLAQLKSDCEAVNKGKLAQISYFKNIIQRDNNKLIADIDFIDRSFQKFEITQKEVKELKERLEAIARLPEVQPAKLQNQQDSCIEEISQLVRACNSVSRSE